MEDWLPKLLSTVIAAIVAAYVGYIHGRWSKHKEIIYQQKVAIYSGLVEKLLEFMMACAPKKNLTFSDYGDVMNKFTDTQNLFFRASLFMPDRLDNDLKAKFRPVNDRIRDLHSGFVRLEKIKNGANLEELGVKDFQQLKSELLASFHQLGDLPGPFLPLVDAIPNIVTMLKKDLGINALDTKFYK